MICVAVVSSSILRASSVFNMRVKRLDVPSAERKFLCEYCGNTYSTILKLHLHQHIRHNHPSTAEIFFCEYCGKTYSTIFNLYLHQHEEHNRYPSAKPEFNCEYCDRIYTRRYFSRMRSRSLSGNAGSTQIFSPPKRVIKKNPIEPTRHPLAKRMFTRRIIKKDTNSSGGQGVLPTIDLPRLTNIRLNDGMHLCANCGKTLPTRFSLYQHERIKHNIPRDLCTRLKAAVIAAEREVLTVLATINGRKKKRGRKSNKEKAEAEAIQILHHRALNLRADYYAMKNRLLQIEEETDTTPTTSMTLELQFYRSRSPTLR